MRVIIPSGLDRRWFSQYILVIKTRKVTRRKQQDRLLTRPQDNISSPPCPWAARVPGGAKGDRNPKRRAKGVAVRADLETIWTAALGLTAEDLEATQRREVGAMGLSFGPWSCSFDWCAWQCLAACMSGAFPPPCDCDRAEQQNKKRPCHPAGAGRRNAMAGGIRLRCNRHPSQQRDRSSGTRRRSVPLLGERGTLRTCWKRERAVCRIRPGSRGCRGRNKRRCAR
jgi:hypothetical protein